jgi:2-amino-4-hydroxy-6-hydroxymethyldihydropteridine diphosphokinase
VVTAYIGLGANIGEPLPRLREAMEALARLPDTRLIVCSSFYRSAPIGITQQPDFVNAVCTLDTGLSAAALLQHLLEIESEHGRMRGSQPGGPRTMDLDLLLYGTERVYGESLTLPHPRMHERRFVLLPLSEIAPTLEIPGRGRVAELLRSCGGQRVERMES